MHARPCHCLVVLLALGGAEGSAQSDTLWTYTAPANIRFTRVGPSGHLLVATEQGLVALNAELGGVAWTYPVGGRLWVRVSSLGHLLVGYGGVMAALDPLTGGTVWHRADLPNVHRESRSVIGSAGFKGPPDSSGTVEIAYGIVPSSEGHGYATEAAAALVDFAFATGQVRLVRAHTLPAPNPSTRVLVKCGFRCTGTVVDPDDGPVWRWERGP